MYLVNTTCNYRCSYCTQRFLDDRKRWLRDGPAFLAAFGRLSGAWEVKISGGEPFLHPNLCEIVEGLRGAGHRVSVVTNFSAQRAKLEQFLAAAGDALRVFSASLHLEYAGRTEAELDEFIAKAGWLAAPRALPSGAASHLDPSRQPASATSNMAEGVGFEPTVELPLHGISSAAPSATRPPLPAPLHI